MWNSNLVAAATACLAFWLTVGNLSTRLHLALVSGASSSISDTSTTTTTIRNHQFIPERPRQHHTNHHRRHKQHDELSNSKYYPFQLDTSSDDPSPSKAHHNVPSETDRQGRPLHRASLPVTSIVASSRSRSKLEYPEETKLIHSHNHQQKRNYAQHNQLLEEAIHLTFRGVRVGGKHIDVDEGNEIDDDVDDDDQDEDDNKNENENADDNDDSDEDGNEDDDASMTTRKTTTTTATTTLAELPSELVGDITDDEDEPLPISELTKDDSLDLKRATTDYKGGNVGKNRDNLQRDSRDNDDRNEVGETDQEDDDFNEVDLVTSGYSRQSNDESLISNEIPEVGLESRKRLSSKRKWNFLNVVNSNYREPTTSTTTSPISVKIVEEKSQKVPEDRMTIVVSSSSDNSYVSSSPIISYEQQQHQQTIELPEETGVKYKQQNQMQSSEQQQAEVEMRHGENLNSDAGDRNGVSQGEGVTYDSGEDELNHRVLIDRVKGHFEVKKATIIKTAESTQSGATFINYTFVTSLNACLVECWITDSCDTAIYQDSPLDLSANISKHHHRHYGNEVNNENNYSQHHREQLHQIRNNRRPIVHHNNKFHDLRLVASRTVHLNPLPREPTRLSKSQTSDTATPDPLETSSRNISSSSSLSYDQSSPELFRGFHICYLFECTKPDGFKCQFSAHNLYTSSTRRKWMPKSEIDSSVTSPGEEATTVPDSMGDSIMSSGSEHKPHFSRIISSNRHHYSFGKWHDSHIASINIVQEENFQRPGRGSLNSAIIALMFGIAATGMLMFLVGLKMNSIRRRFIISRRRRQSLVPDTEFLINSLSSHR